MTIIQNQNNKTLCISLYNKFCNVRRCQLPTLNIWIKQGYMSYWISSFRSESYEWTLIIYENMITTHHCCLVHLLGELCLIGYFCLLEHCGIIIFFLFLIFSKFYPLQSKWRIDMNICTTQSCVWCLIMQFQGWLNLKNLSLNTKYTLWSV